PDVVYAYTPPGDITVDIDLCNSSYDTKVYVYENGETPGSPYACNDDACGPYGYQSALYALALTSGNTYYIVVDGYGGDSGNYELIVTEVAFYPPPPNDDCASAQYVDLSSVDTQTLAGTTLGATIDCPGVLNWNAVWYEVYLPYTSNNLTIDYCGSDPPLEIVGVVYFWDCSCSGYVLYDGISWNSCSGYPTDTNPTIYYNNIPGPVSIFSPAFTGPGRTGQQQDFTITFTNAEVVPPDNETCAEAEPVGEVTDYPFDTSLATATGFGYITSNDLWYVFTAPADGMINVDLCGSTFDTKLAIYEDCVNETPIDYNDDSAYCNVRSLQSAILYLAVVTGEDYYIQVGGYGSASGTGDIKIDFIGPGDICDLALEAFIGTNSADNTSGDQWFYYSPVESGIITVSSAGAGVDTYLEVHSDCFGTIIGIDDDGLGWPPGESILEFLGFAGETYYIVWRDYYSPGIYNWSISVVPIATIYDVQYTEDPSGDSPLVGQSLQVYGIVSAIDFAGDSFFMVDPAGGPWNGLYVYNQYALAVAVGDEVLVTGDVEEYYGFTELIADAVTILSTGNAVPLPMEIITGQVNQEMYESCFVSINNVVVTQDVDTYGQWYVDDGMIRVECQIDDGFNDFDSGDAETSVGTKYNSIIGFIDYAYSEFGLNPRNTDDLDVVSDVQVLDEGFEGTFPPDGWTVIDNDGGSVFNATFTYFSAHTGSQGAQAMGCQDDYLITPLLSPTAGDNTFGYWVRVESSSYDNSFEIMVSTSGTAIGDFTQIADYPYFNTNTWTNLSEDLSAYNGQNIYVAIHVYYSESSYWDFGFDDITGPALTPVVYYGVDLTCDEPSLNSVGDPIDFVVTLINTGSGADIYDLSVSDAEWPVTLLDADGVTEISTLDVPGFQKQFYVHVEVPQGTRVEMDEFTVTATSQNDGSATDDVILTANRFYLQYMPYYETFEVGDGDYYHDGNNDCWEWGTPTSGPGYAYSGDNVWATVLDGNYTYSGQGFLYTGYYDLTTAVNPIFDYYHWYNFESGWDGVNVKISTDGGTTWELITPVGGYPDQSVNYLDDVSSNEPGWSGNASGLGWHRVEFDLTAYAGNIVRFKFTFGADSYVFPGYYFDDIKLHEPCPILSMDPSSIDFGEWQVGQTGTDYVTISNSPSAPIDLEISSITASSPYFTMAPVGTMRTFYIPPGGSMDFEVTFSPIELIEYDEYFTIISNDPFT
ncbi:MAG: choice-of-anchor J domain-containing protein, partial [Candidatus Cloacimonetes bacterium]|nr:choice-of-anchor J domain-containing protein [Candidatus Cloacimonadota bacterium]